MMDGMSAVGIGLNIFKIRCLISKLYVYSMRSVVLDRILLAFSIIKGSLGNSNGKSVEGLSSGVSG